MSNADEIEALFTEYWQTEGIRFLAEGNRVPTPYDRSRHAFFEAWKLASLTLDFPTDCHIAAIELEERE